MAKGDHFRRLRPDQVAIIITSKEPTRQVASTHGVCERYVRKLRAGLAWKALGREVRGRGRSPDTAQQYFKAEPMGPVVSTKGIIP